jgi:carotenoid cleavage dioxygenase-like enzyme
MTAIEETDTQTPFYMRGNYAPVADEVEAFDLDVVGTIPTELSGRFFRNGANPPDGVVPSHWFDGDGMLHGIRLSDGKAEWYRNRWIRTKLLAGGERMNPETFEFDLTAGRANTHVMRHAGRIMALEEASLPTEISPELETLGSIDFGGKLATPCTAHPHVCAETGEMHFFGYQLVTAPFVTYHVADRAGQIIHSQPVDIPNPVMMHDFALSRNHAIFLDLPVVFDLDVALSGGGMPFCWRPDAGSRIGLVDRRNIGTGAPVEPRWFEIDSCYVKRTTATWWSSTRVVICRCGTEAPMHSSRAISGAGVSTFALGRSASNNSMTSSTHSRGSTIDAPD